MPASSTDADGNKTSWLYDSEGNTIQKTDALGYVTTYTYEPVFNMMTSMTDPRGRKTTYTYDGDGNRVKETDPLGQTQSWTYDSHGNVLSATDKDGNTTTYQYDAFGDLLKITDPLGNMTTMTYDAVGNMLARTDADGHTTSYQYDGMNRVTLVTDPTGHTDQTFYDGEGNRTQTIDRDGHATLYQYDLRQRLVKMTDALSQIESYTYDGNDNRISLTDRDGHTTMCGYDVQNWMNTVTDALGDVTTTTYDLVGNVMSQTDADGHTTTYTYDPLNRRSTMTDALSEQTQYFYDTGAFTGPVRGTNCIQCGATPGSSLVTEQIDPDGSAGLHAGVIYYKYDALDRLVIKVQKQGCIGAGCPDTITGNDAVTTYTYDPVGNRLIATQPDGVETTYLYDADNRLIQETIMETSEPNDVTTTTYDGVNNVITVTAPNLNVTTNVYDSLNRLIQVTDSVGPVASYTYDPVGNRVSSTDGDGNTTSYAYDALNRLTTITDPLGKTTTDSPYDPVGNLLKVTDRNGNATMSTYDAINRRIGMTDALGNVTQWKYDPVGNMIKLTDANLHSTQYSYDAVNRPLCETYADGTMRCYTYDPAGNVTERQDAISGQTVTYSYTDLYFLMERLYAPSGANDTFTYDFSGRMLTNQRVNGSFTWPESFSYDSANRLLTSVQDSRAVSYTYDIPARTRAVAYPGGRTITETTDYRARMDHIGNGSSPPPIVQYTYDLSNNMLSRNYANGTTSSYTYNGNNWTISIAHQNPATFAGFNYAYDNEGNKQYELKSPNTSQSECYGYDATYRVTSYLSTVPGTSTNSCPGISAAPLHTQTSYVLDPVGNWISKTTNGMTQPRVHNSVNEITEINSTSLSYDNDGDLTNDGTYTYFYDEEHRLACVTTAVSCATFAGQYQYDALSRRVQKIANPTGSSSATTLYFYDNARIIEEQSTGGVTQATYVYGNYVDEILTMDRGGSTYYYHQNALWSVEAVTNSSGSPVERYDYCGGGTLQCGDPYGAVSITDGSFNPIPPNAWGTPHSAIGNPWMFTGRELDEEAGLYYYRARHYDTFKGRFLERDPLGYVEGANLYEFVRSNPVRFLDPNGTAATDPKVVDKLIRDLDADKFAVRDRATGELELLAKDDPNVEQMLRNRLAQRPSLEGSTRIEGILATVDADKVQNPQKLGPLVEGLCKCLDEDAKDRIISISDGILKNVVTGSDLLVATERLRAINCALSNCVKDAQDKDARKFLSDLWERIGGLGGGIDELQRVSRDILRAQGESEKTVDAVELSLDKRVRDCR
jgi:RHS repeat-associated protein